MADNTHDKNDVQWWAKVDIKTWASIGGIFFLISGGVESIKSSVLRIENTQIKSSEEVREIKILQKEISNDIKRLDNNDLKKGFDIENIKSRLDIIEKKIK